MNDDHKPNFVVYFEPRITRKIQIQYNPKYTNWTIKRWQEWKMDERNAREGSWYEPFDNISDIPSNLLNQIQTYNTPEVFHLS